MAYLAQDVVHSDNQQDVPALNPQVCNKSLSFSVQVVNTSLSRMDLLKRRSTFMADTALLKRPPQTWDKVLLTRTMSSKPRIHRYAICSLSYTEREQTLRQAGHSYMEQHINDGHPNPQARAANQGQCSAPPGNDQYSQAAVSQVRALPLIFCSQETNTYC